MKTRNFQADVEHILSGTVVLGSCFDEAYQKNSLLNRNFSSAYKKHVAGNI